MEFGEEYKLNVVKRTLEEHGVSTQLFYFDGYFGLGAGYSQTVTDKVLYPLIEKALSKKFPSYRIRLDAECKEFDIFKSYELFMNEHSKADAREKHGDSAKDLNKNIVMMFFVFMFLIVSLFFKIFVNKPII